MHQSLVVLATSRKNGGICLAGKRVGGAAEWVRPVSEMRGQAWSRQRLADLAGHVPAVGERIVLPLTDRLPSGYQRENRAVGTGRWRTEGRIDRDGLMAFIDTPDALWLNGWHGSAGRNDRVPFNLAMRDCDRSLLLIRPDSLRFRIHLKQCQITVRAEFSYRGQRYDLSITDDETCSDWVERLACGHDGRADALLCLSLGLPYEGYCYKLVAGVVEPNAEGRS